MTGISGIQTAVNTVPAPAVEGDFASANPRFTALAGPGGYVAGLAGLRIAYFCWESDVAIDPDNNPTVLNSFGHGPVTGFVHREQQGLFTQFLATSGMLIQPGMGAVASSGGDFWVTNNGATYAQKGMKAYADLATGKVSFAATASAATVTAATSAVTAPTNAFTGSIQGNVLTVTGGVTGTIALGTVITGSGVSTGNTIDSQLSGTAGGIGTYAVSIAEQNVVAGTAMTGVYGLVTLGAAPSGTIPIGAAVSGGSATGYIRSLLTGTGGNGSTYSTDNSTTQTSTTLTFTTNVETKWIAMSSAGVGEILKMSDHPLG